MKLPVFALAGAILSLTFGAQAAPMTLGAPAHRGLVQEARVTCAYLTRDGYCVRPRKVHKEHWKHRKYYQRAYRTYEAQPPDEYYWRYERPRPIIRVVPDYQPLDDDEWDD
ncbi:hypothetical protein ACFX5Q_19560 [Mesorhizobium sp. IMUNJ 23033]|uniref:hypothetical protein n=1 Tax=Mesorhizobium sp. IMUNJ 23033 TaxID=3378039 RepID=UPI00384A8009